MRQLTVGYTCIYTYTIHMVILAGEPGLASFPLDSPSSYILLNSKYHPTVSLSGRKRDGGEGRGVEGKYIPFHTSDSL